MSGLWLPLWGNLYRGTPFTCRFAYFNYYCRSQEIKELVGLLRGVGNPALDRLADRGFCQIIRLTHCGEVPRKLVELLEAQEEITTCSYLHRVDRECTAYYTTSSDDNYTSYTYSWYVGSHENTLYEVYVMYLVIALYV